MFIFINTIIPFLFYLFLTVENNDVKLLMKKKLVEVGEIFQL